MRSSGDPVLVKKEPEQEAKKENIIIIGAEIYYDSFWYKMMFMSCGYAVAAGTLKPEGWTDADMTTVFVIRNGYNAAEIGKIQQLETEGRNIQVVLINSLTDLIASLNRRLKSDGLYKINRLAIFSHGYIYRHGDGVIALLYDESWADKWAELDKKWSRDEEERMSRQREEWISAEKEEHISQREEWISRQEKWISEEKEQRVSKQMALMALSKETIPRLHKDIFSDSAIFYSYACRTATGNGDDEEDDRNSHAEDSLARFIANYFKIKVRAFYRRTDYKYVMIPEKGYDNAAKAIITYDDKSKAISAIVRQKRDGGFEGQKFDINGEYEALLDPENGYGRRPSIVREAQSLGVTAARLTAIEWGIDLKILGAARAARLLEKAEKKVAEKGGPVAEGVNGYALWRKGGALSLPTVAKSPEAFPDYMGIFEPDDK